MSDTSAPANPYEQAWAERRFVLARCARCGRFSFPAYPVCPQCRGAEIVWDAVSGHGALYSWAVAPARPHAGSAARVLILIDLDEQVRVPGTLVDCAPDRILPDRTGAGVAGTRRSAADRAGISPADWKGPNGMTAPRVAIIGVGATGSKIAREIHVQGVGELVGGLDTDPAKVGRDLGELVGVERLGIAVVEFDRGTERRRCPARGADDAIFAASDRRHGGRIGGIGNERFEFVRAAELPMADGTGDRGAAG